MSLIYLRESDIEASFLTAVYAFNLNQKNQISYDLDKINYPPLKISFCLLNFLSSQRQLKPNFEQELFPQHIHSFSQLSLDEGAIALFPIFLYYYGDNHGLERELEWIKTNYWGDNININSYKILIVVINLIINKQSISEASIKQIINDLEEYKEEEIREIKLIKQLISEKIYLTQAQEILKENIEENSLGIYQSLYNFFCLPHSPKTALVRSQKFRYSQQITKVLTGFLLGLNNGNDGISILGDFQYQGKKIQQIIKQFVAQWQGHL